MLGRQQRGPVGHREYGAAEQPGGREPRVRWGRVNMRVVSARRRLVMDLGKSRDGKASAHVG